MPKGIKTVELNGVGYSVDYAPDENRVAVIGHTKTFVDPQDVTTNKGEHSLRSNWAIKQTDWSAGEDQKWWDSPLSSESKFKDAYGVDISVEGEISSLNATAQSLAHSAARQPMVVANGSLYLVGRDGTTCKVYKYDGSSWDSGTAVRASDQGRAIADDGTNLYVGLDTGTIYKAAYGGAFSEWNAAGAAGITDLLFVPRESGNVLYGVAVTKFRRFASDGSIAYTYTLPSSWTLEGLISYRGSHVVFGATNDLNSRIYEYDGTSTSVLEEMPPGFVLTGLASIDANAFLIMGYRSSTNTSAGIGEVYRYENGSKTLLGSIGTDIASKEYGPRVALRRGDEVMIGWNYARVPSPTTPGTTSNGAGLYRYSLKSGGLSKNIYTTNATGLVEGIAYYKGKWFFSVHNDGVYTTNSNYQTDAHIDGSITGWRISNEKLLTHIEIERELKDVAYARGSNTYLTTPNTGNYYTLAASTSGALTAGGAYIGHMFTAPSSNAALRRVVVAITQDASDSVFGTDDIICELRTASAQSETTGDPTTTVRATSSRVFASNIVKDTDGGTATTDVYYNLVSFEFNYESAPLLTASNIYALVFRRPTTSRDGDFKFLQTSVGTPDETRFSNDGSSWSKPVSDGGLAIGIITTSTTVAPRTLISLDDGNTYQEIPTAQRDQNREKVSFPLKGLKTTTLGYRIVLAGSSTQSNTIRAVTLKAKPIVEKTKTWSFIVYSDEEVDPDQRRSWAIWNDLETAYSYQSVLAFKGPDFRQDNKVSSVVFNDLKRLISDEDEYTGQKEAVAYIELEEI